MEFTGERVIPGRTDPDLMNEHRARYSFAEAFTPAKVVLDAGCGVGYGAAHLAERACKVAALDSAAEALQTARSEYGHPRVQLIQGDCRDLPFPDHSFEVVVAFELMEHLEDWRRFLTESKRVLAPQGKFIVSTPNRLYYAEARTEPNPFHVREFDYEEFRQEIHACFPHSAIFLQNHSDAITFTPLERQGVRTQFEPADPKPEEAHFFVAVSSMQPLDGLPAYVYLPGAGNVLRERERHIRLLQEEIRQKEQWLEETTAELKKLSKQYRAEQKQAQESINQLEEENRKKTEWAEQVKDELASKQEELLKCVELLDKAEATVMERTEWAQRLDRQLAEREGELAALYASRGYRISRRLGLSPPPRQAPPGAQEPDSQPT